MFQSNIFNDRRLFGEDPLVRDQAIAQSWQTFRDTRDKILAPSWEDRVVNAQRFGQDTRLFWDETLQQGAIMLPGRPEPVRFTRDTPFLTQLLSHYQIDKRLIDRLLDTRNPKHREVMEFLVSSLMLEPFREVREGAGRMVRMINEGGTNPQEAMAFLSSNYLRLDMAPYFQALETWAIAQNLVPVNTWAVGGDAGVNLVRPGYVDRTNLRKGEAVAFGLSTRNSMVGGASFQVDSRALVLVCTNGMMGSEFLGRFIRRHVGKRLAASDNAITYTDRETEDVTTILNRAQQTVSEAMDPKHHEELQDAIRTAVDMRLEDRMDAFRRARAAFMENQKTQGRMAQELQNHTGLSMGESIGVLNRWFEEPGGIPANGTEESRTPSAWGLIQATTRLARDVAEDKPVRQSELETAGGSMLKAFRDSRKEFDRVANGIFHAAKV